MFKTVKTKYYLLPQPFLRSRSLKNRLVTSISAYNAQSCMLQYVNKFVLFARATDSWRASNNLTCGRSTMQLQQLHSPQTFNTALLKRILIHILVYQCIFVLQWHMQYATYCATSSKRSTSTAENL